MLETFQHTAQGEKHFYLLLDSKDVGAVEVLAAFNRITLGEWYGPVLYSEMVKHRTAIIKEATAFTRCVPRGSSWSLPAELTLDAENASTRLQNLKANVECSLE